MKGLRENRKPRYLKMFVSEGINEVLAMSTDIILRRFMRIFVNLCAFLFIYAHFVNLCAFFNLCAFLLIYAHFCYFMRIFVTLCAFLLIYVHFC